MIGIGANGAPRWSARFDTLAIGDEVIKNPRIGVIATANENEYDLILGRDFLRQHRVLFARSQKKLYISYTGNGDPFFVSEADRIDPWLQREADEGNPDAESQLAAAFRAGKVVARDAAAANKWFARAAAHGHQAAQLLLGRRLLLQGYDAAAAPYLRAALDQAPDDAVFALWLYIARVRTDQITLDSQKLTTAFKPMSGWPAPVAQYYLGHIDAEDLFAQRYMCHAAASVADLLTAQGKQAESDATRATHAACKLVPRPALGSKGGVAPEQDMTVDIPDDSPET